MGVVEAQGPESEDKLSRYRTIMDDASSARYSFNGSVQTSARTGGSIIEVPERALDRYEQQLQHGTFDMLTYFPSEVRATVLRYLDDKSLGSCAGVCRHWRQMVEDDSVWRDKYFQNGWGVDGAKLSAELASSSAATRSGQFWKQLYKTRHALNRRWIDGPVAAKTLSGHVDSIYCALANADIIITGSRDRSIIVWDRKTMSRVRTLEPRPTQNDTALGHSGSVLCLAMDDEILVSGSSDSTCVVWRFPNFEPVRQLRLHQAGVLDVALDKRYIVSCSRDGTICVCDRTDPHFRLLKTLRGHRGPVNAVRVLGDHVFSAGGDGKILMWDIAQGEVIRTFSGHKRGLACIQHSEDGSVIVSGSKDNTIIVWDVATARPKLTLIGHQNLVRSLYILGDRIISGSYDLTIKIWDLNTGRLLRDLNGFHGSWIFSVAASSGQIVSTSLGIHPVILDFTEGLDAQHLTLISK